MCLNKKNQWIRMWVKEEDLLFKGWMQSSLLLIKEEEKWKPKDNRASYIVKIMQGKCKIDVRSVWISQKEIKRKIERRIKI